MIRSLALRLNLCLALCLPLSLSAPLLASDAVQGLLDEKNAAIVPRYLLQDANGRSVSNEDFRGKFQLIAFGYTYCPDICPTTLVEMAAILKDLGEQATRLQAIFITVDPERDTGKVLKTYTEFFDPRIIGLSGSPALTRRAADNFKIRYAKVQDSAEKTGNYAVDHSAGMILLGPDGRFVKKFAFATPVDQISRQILSIMTTR